MKIKALIAILLSGVVVTSFACNCDKKHAANNTQAHQSVNKVADLAMADTGAGVGAAAGVATADASGDPAQAMEGPTLADNGSASSGDQSSSDQSRDSTSNDNGADSGSSDTATGDDDY